MWERFEFHNNYNLDKNPKIFSKTNFGQFIMPIYERRYDLNEGEFFTPDTEQEYDNALEPEVFEALKYKTKEEYMSEVAFITEEQRKLNFEQYLAKVKNAESGSELSKIGKMIYDAQQKDNGIFFFPKGGSKQFWDLYKAKKQVFAKLACKELDDLLSSSLTPMEAKRLKQNIYNIKILDIKTKKEYWNKCDTIIQGRAA